MSRRVITITGAERTDFLQDLVTNDVTNADRLSYAALLTPQGKYLFDFFVSHDGDTLLIDVAEDMAEALTQRLTMYRLHRKLGIELTDLAVSRGTGTPVSVRSSGAMSRRFRSSSLTPFLKLGP